MNSKIILVAILVYFQSVDRSGSISISEFMSVRELKENPLVKRVVNIFVSDLNGKVNFKGKT